MAGINNSNEPSTAPQPNRWYNLTLGSSFNDQNPSKFCTLRYEFKPASIDKNQIGTLHKGKDNKVAVEFQNIQPGKPKVAFEGTSEDYKDNDAVLFFDGNSFRLERLHRAVKRLRHNRMLGESTGAGVTSTGLSDANSPPLGKGIKHQPLNKDTFHPLPVEVERIDIGDPKGSDTKPKTDKTVENRTPAHGNSLKPSPEPKNDGQDEEEDLLDIMNADEDDGNATAGTIDVKELDFDINVPHQTDTDDEIADVDVSDGEGVKGPNTEEALTAQVNAEGGKRETSSSSSSSGSDSSGSGSGSGTGSSSSDSESSDADSVNSV